ncbi:hypothetical protein CFP56_000952 [Quercus suber]|uniref:Uncharacterized protein n=1 Tax=Quercus suber TaxID=58331 RepID=A0AAW0INP1_QUESU
MGLTIDVDEDPKGTKMDGSDVPRKTQKRKRVSNTVAMLMEETELPLSKLVEEIHQKLKDGMSAATVKNSVLKVG